LHFITNTMFKDIYIVLLGKKQIMKMVVSFVSVEHSALKQGWAKAKQDRNRPPQVLGRLEKLPEEKDGLVCIIDETGAIHKSVKVWMPTGILVAETCLLIASPWSIHRMDRNLAHVEWNIFSMNWFNDLHSISRTQSGFLVTSTALDLLLEFDQSGRILWSWWAIDHGFNVTPMGLRRFIKKSADHRGFFYSTPAQTTHMNSAVELANGDILASLFHQGMIIYIQRGSGRWWPLLEGLNHPHSLRLQDGNCFTVADSAHGRALLIIMSSSKKASIEREIKIDTEWLADCFYEKECDRWWLLDAHNSHVVIFHEETKHHACLAFNPEWRLFALQPLSR
jgi:hypothetical protein